MEWYGNGLSNWKIVCLLIGEWNGDARSFRRRGGGRREAIGERERERREKSKKDDVMRRRRSKTLSCPKNNNRAITRNPRKAASL